MKNRIVLLLLYVGWAIGLFTFIIPTFLWIFFGIKWIKDGVDYIDSYENKHTNSKEKS